MDGKSRSGAARRKPVSTLKVRLSWGKKSKAASSSDSEEFSDLENSLKPASPCNSVDSESIPELPEGTVIVNPEPVHEKKPRFQGPEFTKASQNLVVGTLPLFNCTACNRQVNPNVKGATKRHPDLGVLLCKKCYRYYKSGEIAQDSDGLDEQCRWCSEGGKLMGCDYCHNAFCKQCILRNFGRAELSKVNGDDDTKWKCYICDKSQLLKLTALCDDMLNKIEKQRQLEKMAANTPKSEKSSKKNVPVPNSNSKANSKPSPSNESRVVSNIKIVPSCVEDVVCKLTGISKTFITMLEVMKTDLEIPYSMVSPYDANKVDSKRLRYATMLQKGLETYTSSIDKILSEQEEPKAANNSLDDDIQIIEPPSNEVKMNGVLEVDNRDKNRKAKKESLKVTLTPKRDQGKEKHVQDGHKKSPTKCVSPIILGDDSVSNDEDDEYDLPVTIVTDIDSVMPPQSTADDLEDRLDLSQKNEVAQLELLQELAEELSNEQQREKKAQEEAEAKKAQETDTNDDALKSLEEIVNTDQNETKQIASLSVSDDETENPSVQESKRGKKESKKKTSEKSRKSQSSENITDDELDKDIELSSRKTRATRKAKSQNTKAKSTDKEDAPTRKRSKRKKKTSVSSCDDDEDTSSSEDDGIARKMEPMEVSGEKEEDENAVTEEAILDDVEQNSEKSCDALTSSDTGKKISQRSKQEVAVSSDEEVKIMNHPKSEKAKKEETEKTGKKKQSDGDTEDDLDKDIKRLSRKPVLTKKAKSDSVKSDATSKKVDVSTAKPKEKKKDLSSESDDDDNNEEDVDEEDVDEEDVDEAENLMNDGDKIDEVMEPMDVNDEEKEDENEIAKKALLDDVKKNLDDDSDDDDDDGTSSSDIAVDPKKTKKKADSKNEAKTNDVKKEEDSDDSIIVPAKKKVKQTKLLNAKLSESDSDVDSKKASKAKDDDGHPSDSDFQKSKKRKHSSSSSSDEDDSDLDDESESASEEDDSDESGGKKKKKKRKGGKKKGKRGKKGKGKKARKRIKAPKDSSDEDGSGSEKSDSDDGEEKSPKKGNRKEIRKIKSDKKLKDETRRAVKAEESRRKRVKEKQEKFNNIIQETDSNSPTKCPMTTQLILERDKETEEPIIEVNKKLVRKLKPHQVEAVQFMYDCCCESVKRMKKNPGSGCILAHCMGLGKTLSVVTFVHTMIKHYDLTNIGTCLVVCPLNTVLNWVNEWDMWLDEDDKLEIYEMAGVKSNNERMSYLEDWHKNGGIMIIGYEMYRSLSTGCRVKSKKMKKTFSETLADPGPDMVVCDEGHILKNDASSISKAMNMMNTRRRIVLTGTPLQNNLVEYHCMVSFVKPNLLGTRKEFLNRFVNPIVNGQCSDSTPYDVKLMKRRAHIIHEMLAGCVQRRDYSSLTKFLPPKMEYVILVRLTPMQVTLYEKYLEVTGQAQEGQIITRGARLFSDYQNLMKIWTHPWVLKLAEIRDEAKRQYNDDDDDIDDGSDLDSFIDDENSEEESSMPSNSDSDDSVSAKKKKKKADSSASGGEGTSGGAKRNTRSRNPIPSDGEEVVKDWKTRSRGDGVDIDDSKALYDQGAAPVSHEWWAEFVKLEDAHKVELSGKLTLLFETLRLAEEIGDKVLVFSQSLLSLNIIEDFLDEVDRKNQEDADERRLKAELKKKEKLEKKKKAAMEADGKEGEKKEGDDEEKKEEEKKEKKEEEKKEEEKKEEEKKEEDSDEEDDEQSEMFGKSWTKGADYFRMDGSTSVQLRSAWSAHFNDPENYRARLFLISTRAGSLGINLVAANRVIIFDASWNPSHDIQSIFRVYRFGQTKPCYIYRLLAQGTMEEKIYERQVTKQSLAQRVVDEHQIDRHFTAADLHELYNFKPDRLDDPTKTDRPTLALPQDVLLAEVLKSKKDLVVNYHTHDSLLENKIDQELSEEDKKAAWEEYENEKKGITNKVQTGYAGNMNMNMGMGLLSPNNLMQIAQMVRSQYPNLPPDMFQAQVQSVLQRQIMLNQEMQNRQIEQQKMLEMERLRRIREQINQQQTQINMQNRMSAQQMFNARSLQNWRSQVPSQAQQQQQQQTAGSQNNLAMLQANLERSANKMGGRMRAANGTAGSSDKTKKPPVNNVIETIDLS